MDISKTLKLNDGKDIPVLGLGTWQSKGDVAFNSVLTALRHGYRHIDSARYYGNEKNVGQAVRQAVKELGLKREDIFVTTKIRNTDHADVEKAFNDSFQDLGLDHIDLYLIHWPVKERLGTWKVMERLLESGKVKSIGVSNFTIEHIKELMANSDVVPAVNQVEFSPFLFQKDLLDFCKGKGIVMEAYSPLTRGRRLGDQRLLEISSKYGKSPAQVLIRWAIQKDVIVLPKSANDERIRENASVFDFSISEDDMENLDSLDEAYRTCWNPHLDDYGRL